jgi:hypothetical protein
MCYILEPQAVFTLRGMCDDSQIDRGYFLINGKKEDEHKTRMTPVYEGYFSQIGYDDRNNMTNGTLSKLSNYIQVGVEEGRPLNVGGTGQK